MYVNWEHYRIFYYAAKYKNLTRAAAEMFNNQPNVTRAVKTLENELGCTLLIRSNKGVELTEEGKMLYEHIRIAFEHIQKAESGMLKNRSIDGGVVTIGATEIALHCLILPILKDYRVRYPGVRIRVSSHSTAQTMTDLKNGIIDFAVVTTPVECPPSIHEFKIKQFHEAAVCGSAFSGLSARTLSLAELAEYPIISLGTHTNTFEFYSSLFRDGGLEFTPDIEADSANQILPMVKNDLGIGFIPEEFVLSEPDQQSIVVLDMEKPIPPRSICLLKSVGKSLSSAAYALECMIKDRADVQSDDKN
ncbi:MAG: LysR family transcriptional regulator [Clostridiales bacterium]|nr:LysR family transcriptional regulator [Clostridiales bacterium]